MIAFLMQKNRSSRREMLPYSSSDALVCEVWITTVILSERLNVVASNLGINCKV